MPEFLLLLVELLLESDNLFLFSTFVTKQHVRDVRIRPIPHANNVQCLRFVN